MAVGGARVPHYPIRGQRVEALLTCTIEGCMPAKVHVRLSHVAGLFPLYTHSPHARIS